LCLTLAGRASAQFTLVDDFNSNADLRPLPPLHSFFPWPRVTWSFSSATNNVSNVLVPNNTKLGDGEMLAIQSPAKGKFILSRSDVQGTDATYSIRFFDDGSQNLGEMFEVFDPSGHWIGVGVNDNVASGKYYCRTDETRATPIQRARTADNNQTAHGWHKLQITVTESGSSCQVDDVDNGMVDTHVLSVDTVRLQGDWDKPAHTVWIDDFTITQIFQGLTPGTAVSPEGYLTNPFGIDKLSSGAFGAREVSDLYAKSAWAAANPQRNAIIQLGLHQVNKTPWGILTNTGACDAAAVALYDASGEWCSEFVREVYLPTVSHSVNFCETDTPLGCLHREYVQDVSEVDDFVGIFSNQNGLFYSPRNVAIYAQLGFTVPQLGPLTAQPGDWLTVPGSSGSRFGHSVLIVGVTDDFKTFYTMEGNITSGNASDPTPSAHCVRFSTRGYYPNGISGALNPDIDAIGKVNTLLP